MNPSQEMFTAYDGASRSHLYDSVSERDRNGFESASHPFSHLHRPSNLSRVDSADIVTQATRGTSLLSNSLSGSSTRPYISSTPSRLNDSTETFRASSQIQRAERMTSTKKWLIVVIPPKHLIAEADGDEGLFKSGVLMPLQHTISAQIGLIAREYSLPSITGIDLQLCLSESGYPPPAHQLKPKLTSQVWPILWSAFLENGGTGGNAIPEANGLPIAGKIELAFDRKKANWLQDDRAIDTKGISGSNAPSVPSSTPLRAEMMRRNRQLFDSGFSASPRQSLASESRPRPISIFASDAEVPQPLFITPRSSTVAPSFSPSLAQTEKSAKLSPRVEPTQQFLLSHAPQPADSASPHLFSISPKLRYPFSRVYKPVYPNLVIYPSAHIEIIQPVLTCETQFSDQIADERVQSQSKESAYVANESREVNGVESEEIPWENSFQDETSTESEPETENSSSSESEFRAIITTATKNPTRYSTQSLELPSPRYSKLTENRLPSPTLRAEELNFQIASLANASGYPNEQPAKLDLPESSDDDEDEDEDEDDIDSVYAADDVSEEEVETTDEIEANVSGEDQRLQTFDNFVENHT